MVANPALTTNDLINLSETNFLVLPLATNQQLNTAEYGIQNAAAQGYLYFDDGKTLKQSPTRFDLYFTIGAAAGQGVLNIMQSKAQNGYPK